MRFSLNGKWYYKKKISREELYGFKGDALKVPSCWNTLPELEDYHGPMYFSREFSIRKKPRMRYFLLFDYITHPIKVWLNGLPVGSHPVGYTPFRVEITRFLQKTNTLVVLVDGRSGRTLPGPSFDWFDWGGIAGDVYIEEVPLQWIKAIQIYPLKVRKDTSELLVKIHGVPSSEIEIFDENNNMVLKGIVSQSKILKIEHPVLWSPSQPTLYTIIARTNEHEIKETFGIRKVSIHGNRILLNGERIMLKGVGFHHEDIRYGRAIPPENIEEVVRTIKELGLNAIRATHYPHPRWLSYYTDRYGLFLWEEIPVYWHIKFNASTLRLAKQMLRELIERDINRPSVIIWGVANEVPAAFPTCYRFVTELINYAKRMDPTRLVTHASNKFVLDPIRCHENVVAINEYFGWYYFRETAAELFLDIFHQTAKNKPWIITEFGAGAVRGFHSRKYEKFSEEKQARIIYNQIRILNSKPYVAGWFIWVFRDFRSPLRTNKYQKGFNRKGLFDEYGRKKLVSRILKKAINSRKASGENRFAKFFVPFQAVIDLVVHVMEKIGMLTALMKKSDKSRD